MPRLVELENRGTDCYMNSILQALFSEQTLIEYLYTKRSVVQNFNLSKPSNTETNNDTNSFIKKLIGCQLLKAFCVILEKLYSPLYNPNDKYLSNTKIVYNKSNITSFSASMNSFKDVIYRTFGDGYKSFTGQQDAHEFLQKILDFMNVALITIGLTLTPQNYRFNTLDLQKYKMYKHYTIINKIFGGSIRTVIKCKNCDTKSSKLNVQDFIDESIAIEENKSVLGQLVKHFEPEELTGNNKYLCEKCGIKTDAVKYEEFVTYPETFICTLKRFDFMHNGQKIDTPIKINPKLFINDERALTYEYMFYSMSIHLGRSLNHGHYISFTRREDDNWYLFDDTTIRRSYKSFDGIIESKDAYVLFYKLVGVESK